LPVSPYQDFFIILFYLFKFFKSVVTPIHVLQVEGQKLRKRKCKFRKRGGKNLLEMQSLPFSQILWKPQAGCGVVRKLPTECKNKKKIYMSQTGDKNL